MPTSGLWVCLVTILQLTTFVLWKRVDSIPHPLGYSLVTIYMRPYSTMALDERASEQVMS